MADGSNKSIRIPTRNNLFKTDTDDAIFNINMLYESLMLTQENLVEKSEFLAEQLEAKEIEQKSRAEFIADTSHELKTPISIIQGYAEGIKYVIDDKETAEEYCDTIIEECGRMTDLVVNMMSLSNIQHTDKLNWVDFSINEFIDERLRLHQKIFEKNSINAFNDIKDSIFGFADTTKLQFVINNLLSNAISYIGGESRQIKIRYDDMDLCYRIYVYNTGEPIPSDALQKLWDSFYRQDSARLRSDGHFGLGLSIVKAIQDVHSQQCGVENVENGVQFWFDIAKGKASEENKE
jgi:signal transduction histidine kinase